MKLTAALYSERIKAVSIPRCPVQPLAAILTAALMLANALAGCCWHHEHATSEEPGQNVLRTASGHDHEHGPGVPHHHHHHGDRPHGGSDGGHCASGNCVYVHKVKSGLSIEQLAFLGPTASVELLSFGVPNRAATVFLAEKPVHRLRLHLWHQVLLI